MSDILTVYSNTIEVVQITDTEIDLIIVDNDSTLVIETEILEVVDIAEQGPPGIQGPPGSESGSQGVAGENISAYKVLVLDNGFLYNADPSNPNHAQIVVGLSTTSGTIGSIINYSITGKVSGGSFNLGRNFAGAAGGLTTIVPTTGWLKLIGIGESSSSFIVDMGPTIERG